MKLAEMHVTARELVAARKKAQSKSPEAEAKAKAPRPESSRELAPPAKNEFAAQNGRLYRERYFDEVAPASIAGRFLKFDGKEGVWLTPDDGEPSPENAEYIALCEEVLWGWIKFRGDGEQPERHMGLYFDDFRPPERNS